MLVNMRTLPKRAIARMERTGGRMNYFVLQDLAADARECVEGFVEGGMSVADALGQMSIVPGVSLGTLMQSATAFLHRVESMIGSEEGNQLGIQKVDDASTAVMRLDATAPGQSVLLYNKGLATEREIVEDLIERDVVAAAEGDGAVTSLAALKAMLLHVEDELVKHGGKRFVPNGKAAGRQDVIEGFARLGQSHFLLKHSQYDMSEQAHNTIEYVQKKLADTQHLVALSKAWDAFANSEEGKAYIAKEGATLERLLSDAGASVAGHYAAARFNAEALHAVKEAYEASFRSLEAARELMAEYEAEQKALDHPAEESVVEVVAAEESVTGEELRIEPEAAVDDETGDFVVPAGAEVVADAADKGRGLVGGNYVEMADGSVYGVALVEDVHLSDDVPQFKKKDSAAGRVDADEDGTTHELAGGWNGNSAPIHVWRRLDGRLEVISGRHRLAHAKKNGVKHIAVRVYDESAGHDAKWAKLHDVEQNILDNTCNAIDVAYYFRNNPLTLGEAEERGLMPKTRAGEQTAASRIGLMVAAYASDDTFTMLVNGQCSAEDAYMACLVAEDAEGQQLALQTRLGGKGGKKASWEYVTALVRGAQQMRPADGGGMLDLFGNDESFRAAAEKQAKYVAAVRAGLKARLNVLTSAGRLNKKGAVSKEMGVKVKTPKDINKLVARIAQLDAAYERLDYELGIPARAEAWDGKSAVPTKLEELEGKGGSFSVQGMTPEMEEIKAAAVADGTFMKAPNGKDSKLNERQWLQVRTAAFKDWFGDWENDPEDASKVVDENGEPKVYYHHTNAEFTEFLHSKKGKTDAGWLGSGFYFYGIEDEGKGYGKNVMACFLNVREPYYASDEDMFRLSEADSVEESEAFTEELTESGYDGVYYNGDFRQEMMVFEPNQIKSATDNRGTFDGNSGDITYSVQGKNLAAVHSLSAGKFLSALELGGMPLPSVAVTRLDKPYSWGGADGIALVGRPEMVDPKKGTEVYSRDAWTGNFPRVEHKVIGKKDRSDSVTDLFQMQKKYQETDDYNSSIHHLNYRINIGYGGEQTGRSDMDYALRQRTGKALFAWQSGYRPRPKMKDAERVHQWLTKEVANRLHRYVSLSPDEYHEKLPEIKEEVRQEIEKVYRESSVIKNAPTPEAAEKRLTSWVNVALRTFDAYSPSALAKELEDVKKIDARVLDVEANLDMLARYADKHKKAYEAWIEEKLNAWFSKESYIHGTRKEATLDNLAEYMLGRKALGKEKGLAFSSGQVRAHHAERMETLADIQRRRELLTDSETSNELKSETNELMEYWREGAAAILSRGMNGFGFEVRDDLMETLAKVKGVPSEEKVRAALRKMFRGATHLPELLNDAKVIGYGVEALKSLHAELEDYMEAVPHRAVKMDEWEYAVMPVALKKNKAVMAGLRENGIKPRFHDGTEEGRKAALAGLVGDDKVSFSVIGPKAATWDKYADRAFKGRDDGKLRAEIDASGAKLKWEELRGKNVAAYRRIVADWDKLPEDTRKAVEVYAEEVYDWQDESNILNNTPEAEFLEQYNKVIKMRDAIKPKREEMRSLLNKIFVEHGGSAGAVLNMKNSELDELAMSLWGPYVEDKVEKSLDMHPLTHGGMKLGDVLDFAELYEAYPELTDVQVRYARMGTARGRAIYGDGEREILINSDLEGEWKSIHSILLHEVQHHIQNIEDFAKGGNPMMARYIVENTYSRRHVLQNEMANTQMIIAWLEGVEKVRREFLNLGDAIARKMEKARLEDLQDKYNDLVYRYNKVAFKVDGYEADALDRGFIMPELGGVTKTAYTKTAKAWENVKDRNAAFPGLLEKMRIKNDEQWREWNELEKGHQKWGNLSSLELYYRLAGEIEARNVQARYGWDMDRRNAIPFNSTLEYPGEALVTFSIASVTAEWENTLDGYLRNRPQPGTPNHTRDLVVCPTPAVMQMVGAKGWDMVVTPGVLDKVMRGKHAVSEEALRQLPAALAAPVCIAVSDTPGCLEVVTELKEGDHNVLVAVQLNSHETNNIQVKVNRIASMYGKERISALLNHPMLYWDKAKARPWLASYRLQLPAIIQTRRASGRRIQTPADLVKYKLQSGLSFSIRGRDMLTEAPLGRMAVEEKMQRLMNYARKEAARFERTFSAGTPNARAAETMGTISSIMGAIHKELPPKFRPRLDGQMRYMEVYARLLESGKLRAYGKLKKAERAAVETELLEALREDKARVEEEYERAKMEALDAAELTGHMDALEAAEGMDVADEVKKRAYLERLAKRSAAEARVRLLADLEVKKRALEAELDALTRDFAAEKLAQIAGRMLKEAADAVETFLIDVELEAVDFLRERLAPKKLPNGKFDKGKMSAEAYRQFLKYTAMMDLSADEVAKRMSELGLKIVAEEARSDDERGDDGETLDRLQDELAALSTYGALRGKKSLETVRKGVAALTKFAENERNAWSGVLELQRARAKRQARICAEALGGATSQQLADNKEKVNKTLGKIRGLSSYMKSLAQVFYGMGRVPELRVLADESLEALSRGHVQLSLREKRAYEQIAKHMETMGLKTERQRNDWMEELKKKHDTGIMLEGKWQTHTLRLSPLEAAEWLEMSKAEREKKRKAMLEAAEKQDKVDAKNVVYEEDIPLLRAKYDEYLKKPGGRKWITTRRDFQLPAPKESLKISKDEALNILLLCEYGDYLDAAYLNGYTDEVLSQLTDFVGSDVLGYGYAMRAILESSGLAEVYEAREGVPFPKVNNYWPGSSFDQSARSTEVDPLDPTVGNGTRHGMLISRVKHRLDFEYLGASNVFLAALAQQNNYIVMGELTAKWRQLLSHNDFARALRKHLGEVGFSKFKELINLLDGAGVMESITQKTLSSLMSKFQSAHAMAVLAWAPVTLVKQLSAFTNAAAWGGGSISRILYHIVRDRVGGGAIKYGDMMRKDYFQARYKDKRYFTEMLGLPRNAKWSRWSTLARTGMGLIEKTDVIANCFSMTALYNMTYADLKKANRGAADPLTEEQMHAACDRVVRNALELGAQPLRRTQKSAWGALANNAVVKATCYMSTETINKIGMALALGKRKGGGWGAVKGWWYLARISALQQCIVMILDLWRNANPEEEEEWQKWLLLNFVTGASGLGVLQSMPILGEVLENATSGYVKTGSLGNMVFDFSGALRGVTDAWRLSTFDITEDVKAKRTSEHDFYVISYKKFNGTVVERKTDVPKDGGMYKGEYLTKEKAEEKALEVGKELALEDAPGVDDWFMCGANLLRVSSAFSGAGNGINSTSKFVSEFSGFLQSLNALANAVRPFMQASRNKEKQEDAKMKAERKRKQEERKAEREAEKEKKKRRSEMLNRG